MMTQAQTQDFLSGNLQQVDLHAIEKELLNLWDQADRSESGDTPRVTRACSHSFIAFSTDDKEQDDLESMVAEIAVKHPSRAILAYAYDSDNQSLDAWVTARCHMVAGKKGQQICCEQIIVKWKGKGTKNLVSVVAPLTIPDLPTYMWWHDKDLDMEKVHPFLFHIDRFIIDSLKLDNQKSPILKLQCLKDAVQEGSSIYDLNWIRTLPWRQSIAHSFDSARGLLELEDLDIISSVDIVEETGKNVDTKFTPGTQSLFLVGWLASKLGWDLESVESLNEKVSVNYRLNRTRITINLLPESGSNETSHRGHLREVTIRLRDEKHSKLKIWSDAISPGLRTTLVSDDDSSSSNICLKPRSQVELIDTVLNCPTKPKAFDEAVSACCDLVRELR